MKTFNIRFKATRKNSQSCSAYRQLVKSGDLEFDLSRYSDDVITILELNDNMEHIKIHRIGIDCDKITGEFRLFVSYE